MAGRERLSRAGVPETVRFSAPEALLPPEVPTRRVVDADEVVAFIASHTLSRYDFAVQTGTSAHALAKGCDGFEAIVVCGDIAAQAAGALVPSRTIVLGDGVQGLKPFARLRKP